MTTTNRETLLGLSQNDIRMMVRENDHELALSIIHLAIQTRRSDVDYFQFQGELVIFNKPEEGQYLYIVANRSESDAGFLTLKERNEKTNQLTTGDRAAAFSALIGRSEY
jgi:hypothetical protein